MDGLVWSKDEVRKFYREVFGGFSSEPHQVGILLLNTRKKYYPTPAQPYVVSAEFIERLFIRGIGTPVGEAEFLRKVLRLDKPEGAFVTKLKLGKLPYFPPAKKDKLPEEALRYFEEHNLRVEPYRNGDEYVESLVIDVPTETMSIYVTLNLHDTLRGADEFIKEALSTKNQLLNTVLNGGDPRPLLRWFSKINVHVYSCTHKKTSLKKYFILDVDTQSKEFAGRVLDFFTEKTGIDPLYIVRTHGGFHFIYERDAKPETEFARSLGAKAKNLVSIAVSLFTGPGWKATSKVLGAGEKDVVEVKAKTPMTPVPGTFQGGARVRAGL